MGYKIISTKFEVVSTIIHKWKTFKSKFTPKSVCILLIETVKHPRPQNLWSLWRCLAIIHITTFGEKKEVYVWTSNENMCKFCIVLLLFTTFLDLVRTGYFFWYILKCKTLELTEGVLSFGPDCICHCILILT